MSGYPVVLGLIESAFFYNHEKMMRAFNHRPECRMAGMRYVIFHRLSIMGEWLRGSMGDDLTNLMIWESSSWQLDPDQKKMHTMPEHDHILHTVLTHKPKIIVAFGKFTYLMLIKMKAASEIDVQHIIEMPKMLPKFAINFPVWWRRSRLVWEAIDAVSKT